MKNVIKDLAASSAVSWGTIAEKIDENFSELENSIPEGGEGGGGLDESQLGEYLNKNEYAKKSDIPSVPTKVGELENDKSFATEKFVKDEISKAKLEGGDGSSVDLSNYATKDELEDLRNTQIHHTQIYGLVYTDGDGVPEVVTYTVTYIINGHGSQPSKVSGVTKLPNPLPTLTESGWTFGGWYTDSALTTKAVAGATLSSNVTLYAKWTEVESGGGEEPEEPTDPVDVTNLFDKNTMVLDGKEFGLGDSMGANASSRAALIPIEPGIEYAFWAEGKPWVYTTMGGVFLLKADQTKFCKFFIRASGDSFADQDGLGYTLNADTTGRGWTFTAPEGAAYLALSVCWRGGDDYADVLMVEVGDTCHDYVAYSESAPAMFALRAGEPTEASNVQDDLSEYEIVKLFNATLRDTVARAQIQALTPTYSVKKWTVLGDSISVNTSHTTKFYHDILGEKYGLEVTNLAASGSGWPSMLANAMPNIPMDAELITIMIGTNDVSRGWAADENGVCSPIESALLYALKNRPNAKLAVITPVPRGDSAANGKGLRNVAKLIVSTCEYYSVPCFNLTTQSGMYPEIAECVSVMYNDAGIHPNLNGQKRIANAIEPFLKTLIS